MTKSDVKIKRWNSLSTTEYKDVYPVVEANAQRHFRCANILASNGEYSNSVAHLILGTEELIKAFVCLLLSKGLSLKGQSWFEKMFTDHKTRHDLIKDFFSIYLTFNYSIDKIKVDGILSFFGSATLNIMMAFGNYSWWKNADELKKCAFYVDFADKVIDPSDVGEESYQVAKNYVGQFDKDITSLMRKLEIMKRIEFSDWERFNFKELDKLRKQAYGIVKDKTKK